MEEKPPPMGVVMGPLSATLLRSKESIERLRQVLLVFLVGLGAGFLRVPVELHPGGLEDADGGRGDLGANAIAGNEGDCVGHENGQGFVDAGSSGSTQQSVQPQPDRQTADALVSAITYVFRVFFADLLGGFVIGRVLPGHELIRAAPTEE